MERGNKIKLYKANNVIHRLDIAGVGHELNDGDIIELGGSQIIIYTPACRLIEYDWKSVSDIQSKIKP